MHHKFFKNITFSLLLGLLILFSAEVKAIDDKDGKPKSRLSKRDKFTDQTEFNKDVFNKSGGDTSPKGLPPDPGGGGDGWPIPVGDGTGILLLGGIVYFFLRKKEKKV